ncbi:MAG TPA: hypothetical protein VEK15_30785 [Vicinamibacteria bacterium]|nr:hypothetical protein [Vicinamibacteria bacterium]
MRVLRKVIRGLCYHHGLLSVVPDDQVWADVQRYEIPPGFFDEMTVAHSEPDIIEYRWTTLPEDELMHSVWRLRFFERTPFYGIVFRSADAMRHAVSVNGEAS